MQIAEAPIFASRYIEFTVSCVRQYTDLKMYKAQKKLARSFLETLKCYFPPDSLLIFIQARSMVRNIDPGNELTFLRIR